MDALKPRRQVTVTAVGYGLQRINPAQIQADRARMVAYPHLVQSNAVSAPSAGRRADR